MKQILRLPNVAVYDDFLEPEDARTLRNHLSFDRYVPVHAKAWEKVWSLNDGTPVRGSVYSTKVTNSETTAKPFSPGTPMYALYEKVLGLTSDLTDLIGNKDEDWSHFTATPFLYPVGSGARWHEDGKIRSGAYIYYFHKKWAASWGGELLIASKSREDLEEDFRKERKIEAKSSGETNAAAQRRVSTDTPRLDAFGPDFDGIHDAVIAANGLGTYISPRPNRMVVLGDNVPHKVNKVQVEAGENIRCTISGFFNL